MKINDVAALDQLCKGKTTKELEEMSDIVWAWIKDVRDMAAVIARRNYRAGDKVEFESRKNGPMIQGVVKTVNVKTVSLHHCSDGRKWKVDFSYLKKIA